MRNVIIGTAGHVDHGKTHLIRALTGIDTDRLSEEKKRGITIELGFAWLDLGDGQRAGIVDVPGHERFIKNMLAGAGGIDLALLIVAADEGVMPQTVEHLGILSLLNISAGVIVLTKCDMVEDDFIDLVEEDVRDTVQGTFLEHAPIMRTSAIKGTGIQELKETIRGLVQRTDDKKTNAPFRLPIDRVFTMEGFGTIVTGTLIEGSLSPGDDVSIYPKEETVRVRHLEVHSQPAEHAYAGQRVAVNLAGISTEAVHRGDVLAPPHSLATTDLLDVTLQVLPNATFSIKSGSRLHLYHASRELLAKVWLVDSEELHSGETGYAQLALEEPTSIKTGDRFIVRFYSPLQTIGGGVVLDCLPLKHKRSATTTDEYLLTLDKGDAETRLYALIDSQSHLLATEARLKLRAGLDDKTFQKAKQQLLSKKQIFAIGEGRLVSQDYLAKLARTANEILAKFHKENPLTGGMRREAMRTTLLPRADIQITDKLMNLLISDGSIKDNDGLIAAKDFTVSLKQSDQALIKAIEDRYLQDLFAPPATSALVTELKAKGRIQEILANLQRDGTLIRLGQDMLIHKTAIDHAEAIVKNALASKGELNLADFRDGIGTSRKYAVAILEHFDRTRVTRLVDGVRVAFSR